MEGIYRKLKYLVPNRIAYRFNTLAGSSRINDIFLLFYDLIFHSKDSILRFENLFQNISKIDNVYSFGSGRMALFSSLKALNIGKGDEVIIPAFTCVVVANAIIYLGAKPIYVDINFRDFNIDVTKIEDKITPNTKAVYAQHTFGKLCDLISLKKICEEKNLYLIEDAAHCLANNENILIGSLSDITFFSFDHSKMINTYSGGVACTNNKLIGDKLCKIQRDAEELKVSQKAKLIFSFLLEVIFYHPNLLWIGDVILKVFTKVKLTFSFADQLIITKPNKYPFPCKFTSFQALIGIRQLERYENNIVKRKKIVCMLSNFLCEDTKKLNNNNLPLLRYSFLVKNRKLFEKKFKKNFDLQIWFTSVVHMRNHDLHEVKYIKGSCPKAEKAAKHIVNFPTHERIKLPILKKELIKNLSWIKNQMLDSNERNF